MVSPVFVASLATIVPAMAALWWFLKRYEGYFEDARVFFSLVVGFFSGLAAAAFEFFTDFGAPDFEAAAGPATAFLFFVVGYGFFESGIKTTILGLGRFRTRRDTPYYGMALGLGFGSMMALMVMANALQSGISLGRPYGGLSLLFLILLSIGVLASHGATAVWVGRGSAEGKLWKGWGMGTLLQIPILGALWLYRPSLGDGAVVVPFPGLFAAAYGIALLFIAQKRVLDHVVPKEIQDKLRRERRREARGHPPIAADAEEE